MAVGDSIIQGKNEYLYIFVYRDLECIGTGDGTIKTFTVSKTPIADSNLDGSVTISDVEVFVGDASRKDLAAATITTVDEETGDITLDTAPAATKNVYCNYSYVFGHVAYAQDYSIDSSLDSKSITPLSESVEQTIETIWKYEGSIKLWNADDLEDDLLCGIDQADDTIGGKYAVEDKLPSLQHCIILKRIRKNSVRYRALSGVKINSLSESGTGGDLSEKELKILT
jgi:hypothetical protein